MSKIKLVRKNSTITNIVQDGNRIGTIYFDGSVYLDKDEYKLVPQKGFFWLELKKRW